MNIAIEFFIFELVHVPNSRLNWFLNQICSINVFPAQNRKSEHHHWILHIQISLGTKFHFKQFWNLGPNLPRKGTSKNDSLIQSTFAQGYYVPGVTFTALFWIAWYHWYFNVFSPKGHRESKWFVGMVTWVVWKPCL